MSDLPLRTRIQLDLAKRGVHPLDLDAAVDRELAIRTRLEGSPKRDMHEGDLYYAEGGTVWKRSIETQHPDGSKSFTLAFPICDMRETVGENGAEAVARLMNAGEIAMTKAGS